MKTLVTEFISLDGVVQAPGGAKEDTDGDFAHGGWFLKYFDPEVIGGTFDDLAKQSDALLHGRPPIKRPPPLGQAARETRSQTGSTRCRSTWCPTRSAKRTSHGILRRSSVVMTSCKKCPTCGRSRGATSMCTAAR
ncbi:protein of unknown function [Candidatus Nitrospira inopinata]|uniref:Bacterial bifunctional deaminase-reductase C-terminal domain-containing protein n=1 Tax=Candidatus Nitrospira inopinata TaxID=1715989 RepID=A0A0S4KRB8_9BACT|nr:protein of unknown function [Candidatus Nitrospira inopinata]